MAFRDQALRHPHYHNGLDNHETNNCMLTIESTQYMINNVTKACKDYYDSYITEQGWNKLIHVIKTNAGKNTYCQADWESINFEQLAYYFHINWLKNTGHVIQIKYEDNPELRDQPKPKEESKTMSTKVSTKHYIGSNNLAEMSDETIINIIANEEAAIKKLEAIETKSKKIATQIADKKENLAAIVELFDAR